MSKEHLKKIWTGPDNDPKPIIYLSGEPIMLRKSALRRFPDILETLRYYCLSYFYMANAEAKAETYGKVLPMFGQYKVRCFLDSGAFSYQMNALKRREPLTQKAAEKIIEDYAEYIYNTDFVFDFFATFDYLRDPVTEAWATKRIEARGLHPVPVYHLGSPIASLRKLIDDGYTLIGLGGLIPYNGPRARPFFDHVFNLTEKHGIRLHGFGIGGQDISRYPWFSVDSSAWWNAAAQGILNQESLDPRKVSEKVSVSSKRTARKFEMEDNWVPRVAHNIKFWTDFMYKLSKREAPKVKRGLF